jgi:hypothetical protein
VKMEDKDIDQQVLSFLPSELTTLLVAALVAKNSGATDGERQAAQFMIDTYEARLSSACSRHTNRGGCWFY